MSDNGHQDENPFGDLSKVLETLAQQLPQEPDGIESLRAQWQKKQKRRLWGIYAAGTFVGFFAIIGFVQIACWVVRYLGLN